LIVNGINWHYSEHWGNFWNTTRFEYVETLYWCLVCHSKPLCSCTNTL